jgi:hypothetical protein
MARVKPHLRDTETYTESNFLRLHTTLERRDFEPDPIRLVTIEHLAYRPAGGNGAAGWKCQTIVDAEPMSKEDALFIAHNYAQQNQIPVIYECHGE